MPPRQSRWKRTLVARQLRANPTPAEARLWACLRNRGGGGFKFRREVPLGDAFANFFCAEAKLVVEVDGSIHEMKAEQDAARTEQMMEGKLHVLRFTNAEVLADPGNVVDRIVAACRERTTVPMD